MFVGIMDILMIMRITNIKKDNVPSKRLTWGSGPLLRMACTSPLFLMEMDINILMFIWMSSCHSWHPCKNIIFAISSGNQ